MQAWSGWNSHAWGGKVEAHWLSNRRTHAGQTWAPVPGEGSLRSKNMRGWKKQQIMDKTPSMHGCIRVFIMHAHPRLHPGHRMYAHAWRSINFFRVHVPMHAPVASNSHDRPLHVTHRLRTQMFALVSLSAPTYPTYKYIYILLQHRLRPKTATVSNT